jgi:putative transcriptional regulator
LAVRDFGSSSHSLAGSLLVAHPGLLDPNFRKSVLYISANDPEEGSFGLILNRPAGQTVANILPERDLGSLARVPVFFGGPVSRDQLVFASFRWQANGQRMECRHHIGIEEAEKLVVDQHATIRAFIGYAGWSKGQLEGELANHAWMTRPPDETLLDSDRIGRMWREMLSTFGPMFRLVAEAPDDPARN